MSINSRDDSVSTVLRCFRTIVYAAFHVSDLTFRNSRLYCLKAGAIDELLRTIEQIRTCTDELASAQCKSELLAAICSEVGQYGQRSQKNLDELFKSR